MKKMTNTTEHQYPVFILDDLAENRAAAEEYFSSIGIPVVFTTTFEEAKTVLEAQNAIFQAYIFDVQVPAHDGEEPTDRSAELEQIASANHAHPHIFLSGRDELDGHGRKQAAFTYEATRGFEKSCKERISCAKDDPFAWGYAWRRLDLCPRLIKAKENAGWGK